MSENLDFLTWLERLILRFVAELLVDAEEYRSHDAGSSYGTTNNRVNFKAYRRIADELLELFGRVHPKHSDQLQRYVQQEQDKIVEERKARRARNLGRSS